MSLGMYEASVPVFTKHLNKFLKLIGKAVAFAEARKIDPAILLNTRVYPDMWPLVRQVQEVTKHVYWTCSLLSGQERLDVPQPETTFAELEQLLKDTVTYLEGFKPDQIDGSENRAVALVFPQMRMDFTGQTYLLGFGLPSFFFHITTTYNILRSLGVEMGKRDYLAL